MNKLLVWVAVAVTMVTTTQGQTPPQETCQIDLAILLDKSGSIVENNQPQNWDLVINFTKQAISMVKENAGSNIALITFGNAAKLEFDFDTTDVNVMLQLVEDMRSKRPNENTNTSSAFLLAYNDVFSDQPADRMNVQDVVLLITDGKPTYGLGWPNPPNVNIDASLQPQINQQVIDQAKRLSQDFTTLNLAVGVTDAIDKLLLTNITTDPDRDFFDVMDFDGLAADLESIINSTCSIVTTPTPPTQCREDSDIYILLDASGSMKEKNYKVVRDFVANQLIPVLGIERQQQVGLMYYSSEEYFLFDLDDHTTVAELSDAIMGTPFMRQKTNAAASLRFLRESAFSSANGGRDGVRQMGLVFTDGNSNIGQTLEEARLTKEAGIELISIGVGDWTNDFELISVASEPYETHSIFARNMSDFNEELATKIKELLCNDVDECSPNPCSCNAECVDKVGDYYCSCGRDECVGKTCEQNCREPADVVFAIDASGSMDAMKFRTELDFVRQLTMRLNPSQSNIGVLKFSTDAEMIFNINAYDNMDDIMNAITMSYDRGSTNTSAAIDMALDDMFSTSSTGRRRVLVLLTDGRSSNFQNTWQTAKRAREAGLEIICVGIGRSANMKELSAIASGVSSNVYTVTDFDALSGVVDSVSDSICNNVDECESVDCGDGTQVDHIGYCECICPLSEPASTGPNCERRCSGEMDIMLIVDSSGSIRNNRWRDVKEFLGDFVDRFAVGEQYTRFSGIFFSTNAQMAFRLNSDFMKEDVITDINEMKFLGDRTNIAEALEMNKDQMLLTANGNRENVPDFAILLSDGGSNIRENEAVPMAVTLREQGVTIIVIAIGDQANVVELRGMATYPLERNYFPVPSFNDIKVNVDNMRDNLIDGLVNATCDDVNECDDNPCTSGTCADLPGMYFCECLSPRSGRNCERQCNAQIDVAIVLDFSDSMDNIYNLIIAFTRELIYGLPSNLRVSVVYYADDADVLFHLNRYTDTFSRLNALSFSRTGTRTNTAAALELLYTEVFTTGNGDSTNPNYAVVLTDGGSSVNRADTIPNANTARNNGINLLSVAFGTKTQRGEINGIANDPDSEFVFDLPDENAVTTTASAVLDKLCSVN